MKLRYANNVERKYSSTAFFMQKASSSSFTIETERSNRKRTNGSEAVIVGAVSQKLHLNLG